jgi:hypothetical protein
MASGPRRLRPWRPSGLYRAQPTPQQLERVGSLRDQLVADRGDPEMVTAAESLLIDLICAASIKHGDAIAYLQTLPRPWCNKRSRACLPVVLHTTTSLASHLAGLLDRLG